MVIVRWLVYGNLYPVVLIAALLLTSCWLYDLPLEWTGEIAFVLAGTLFLYPAHRVFGVHYIPPDERSERHCFAHTNRYVLGSISVLGALGAFIALRYIPPMRLSALVPFGIISMAYVFPMVYVRGRWIRLREVPYLKVVWIAATVSWLTAVFPFLGEAPVEALASNALARFFFLVALTLPFDIRDYAADKRQGIQTLPVVWGIDRTRKVALLSNVCFTLVNLVAYLSLELFPLAVFLALWVSEIIADVFIQRSEPLKSEWFFAARVEGSIVIQCVLVTLATFLF
ncbi:MAG: UbiA family prenyltransferase [Leptolyngbya sp. SIO3F4]|nr:UbiA family prenyltransferase [Leptolyngbya sp. SIO3F4]